MMNVDILAFLFESPKELSGCRAFGTPQKLETIETHNRNCNVLVNLGPPYNSKS